MFTFEARLLTRAMIEFLKFVPAVGGRFVTLSTLCAPSGHIFLMESFELIKHSLPIMQMLNNFGLCKLYTYLKC